MLLRLVIMHGSLSVQYRCYLVLYIRLKITVRDLVAKAVFSALARSRETWQDENDEEEGRVKRVLLSLSSLPSSSSKLDRSALFTHKCSTTPTVQVVT